MAETTSSALTAEPSPSVRAALLTAVPIASLALGTATFEFSMADWPSSFVLLVLLPATALAFVGGSLWSLALLRRIRSHGARFAVPFLVYALTFALLWYAPLQRIALQWNFTWHQADRERIVKRIEAGELRPNVGYNRNLIALGDAAANVSAGNDIVVDQAAQGTYVLFLTSRGLKHYFTGFLHVPPGADPKNFFEFDDKPPTRLVRYDTDWYFVAN